MMPERVFVTGLGVVSPLGVGVEALFDGLRAGRSGIVRMDDQLDLDGLRVSVGAPCRDFEPAAFMDKKQARRMGRASQLAVAAAKLALDHGELGKRDGARGAVVVGTGIGAMEAMVNNHLTLLERGAAKVSPFLAPVMMPNAPAAETAIHVGVTGPSVGVVTACAAAAHAIGLAWDYVRSGLAEWALAGGAESVMLTLVFAAFDRMGALTPNPDPATASRPFDVNRDGFVMGEGAGILLLESEQHARRRGAEALAEIVGFGATCDAYHITAPPEGGEGAPEPWLRLYQRTRNVDHAQRSLGDSGNQGLVRRSSVRDPCELDQGSDRTPAGGSRCSGGGSSVACPHRGADPPHAYVAGTGSRV